MASLTGYFSKLFSDSLSFETELIDKRFKLATDKNGCKPDYAWSRIKREQTIKVLKSLDYKTRVRPDRVRFVCISDTHTKLETSQTLAIPNGDVLLHAGDLTMFGKPNEVHIVNEYLGTLPHKHKVVIAGNHDMTFDLDFIQARGSFRNSWNLDHEDNKKQLKRYNAKSVHEMMTNCYYLEDSMVEIYGIKIYGSPWSTGSGSWGFQCPRGAPIMSKWDNIPDDTDILITHSPPVGYGDDVHANTSRAFKLKAFYGMESHVGCVDLLNTIQKRVKPSYHIYGHIHEGYGVTTDGTTTFINAATCTESYHPVNPPIIFDVPLPAGYTKDMAKEDAVKWIIPTKIVLPDHPDDYEVVFTDETWAPDDQNSQQSDYNVDSDSEFDGFFALNATSEDICAINDQCAPKENKIKITDDNAKNSFICDDSFNMSKDRSEEIANSWLPLDSDNDSEDDEDDFHKVDELDMAKIADDNIEILEVVHTKCDTITEEHEDDDITFAEHV